MVDAPDHLPMIQEPYLTSINLALRAISMVGARTILSLDHKVPLGTAAPRDRVDFGFIPLAAHREMTETEDRLEDGSFRSSDPSDSRPGFYVEQPIYPGGVGIVFVFFHPDPRDRRQQRAIILEARANVSVRDYELKEHFTYRPILTESELQAAITQIRQRPGRFHLEPRKIRSLCARFAFPFFKSWSREGDEAERSEDYAWQASSLYQGRPVAVRVDTRVTGNYPYPTAISERPVEEAAEHSYEHDFEYEAEDSGEDDDDEPNSTEDPGPIDTDTRPFGKLAEHWERDVTQEQQ